MNSNLYKTLLNGALCKCPKCGQGKIFPSLLCLKPKEKCDVCGFNLRDCDSGDGPAVFGIFILGFTLVPIALWTFFHIPWPFWLQISLWSVILLFSTIGLLKPIKALFITLQYRYRKDIQVE